MDDAAAECSLAVPTTFATNTEDSYAQLKRYMVATAKELLQRIDWANCTLDGTITGDGGSVYDLETDFYRLTRSDDPASPAVWSDGMRRGFTPVTSNGEWTVLLSYGPTPTYAYRIVGSQIEFAQDIAVGDTVTYSYLTTGWISSSGSRAATWTNDADFTYLPAKLLELGTTWRWMRKRGLEFQSYQGEFEIELARRSNDDRMIRKIGFGPKAYQSKSPYANLPVPTLGPDPNV